MIAEEDMKPIAPRIPTVCPSVEHVSSGIPIPKSVRVTTFSPDEWEDFIEEWATCLENTYADVMHSGGAGDLGRDIIGFVGEASSDAEWDNYQCKHYDHPLYPSDIWIEIGKVVYYSYKNKYSVPRKYYFIAPRNVGTSLGNLLAKPQKLKENAKRNWETHCQDKITETASIPLEGDLLDWFEAFDFSIFSTKSVAEILNEHAKTPFHSVRFGGGLPLRPAVISPPEDHAVTESCYIQQLFNAYGDYLKKAVNNVSDLSPKFSEDFLRQRARFYHAESLRNFARDTVPNGTFENLQQEIFHGVVDTCNDIYSDGLARMRKTLTHSTQISITSNPLVSAVTLQDRQGICHQLANEDQLVWVPTAEEGLNDNSF